MHKPVILLSAALGLSLALPALAQEKPGNVGRVFVNAPKTGMAQQYEEGRKRHMEWHRKQGDTWTWETWQVQTGEAMGAYVILTFGHNWKDFDTWDAKYGKGDAADAAANMGPALGAESNGLWVYRGDVSRPPEGNEPSKMVEVFHFIPKMEAESEFDIAIKRIHEAIGKTNWPHHYSWFELVNGGEQPHYVLVLPLNSWADMAPGEVSFEAMLEKAYGRQEADALTRSLDRSIHRQWNEILAYRPDLSYRPVSR